MDVTRSGAAVAGVTVILSAAKDLAGRHEEHDGRECCSPRFDDDMPSGWRGELPLMRNDGECHVYVLASLRRVLYIGVTSELRLRIWKHRTGLIPGFTSRYRVNRLVYFEAFRDMRDAITREKRLKGWTRARKERLVSAGNAGWRDLSVDWFAPGPPSLVDPGCAVFEPGPRELPSDDLHG